MMRPNGFNNQRATGSGKSTLSEEVEEAEARLQ